MVVYRDPQGSWEAKLEPQGTGLGDRGLEVFLLQKTSMHKAHKRAALHHRSQNSWNPRTSKDGLQDPLGPPESH